jgi:hypothetical protein
MPNKNKVHYEKTYDEIKYIRTRRLTKLSAFGYDGGEHKTDPSSAIFGQYKNGFRYLLCLLHGAE